MKVEVEWKKVVKPSAPTPHHLRKLKLSSMDEPLPPHYTGIIFYYADNAENSGVDIVQRLHRMEKSLSQILTIFYPLAGRYIEDGCFIDCNDHGVEFVHAKVDARIDRLLHGKPDPDLLDGLSRFPGELAGNPLVVIQANVFECGGLVIGVRMTHKIADMYSMAMFVSSWATACRGNTHGIVRPSFELSSIFPMKESSFATGSEPCVSDESSKSPSKESSVATGPEPSISDEKLVTNRFRFDGKVISKLKSLAVADAPGSTADNSPPSRLEVVSALISTALVDIDLSKHGKLRPFVISMTMNLREKIGLAVPANSFGNFATVLYAQFGRAMADGSKLVFKEAVSVINEMLRKSRARYARVEEGEELSTMVKDSLTEFMEHATSSEKHFIAFSSWCRFPLYEIDFGWGRPTLVGLPPVSFRSVFLMDAEDNEGIDAWVTLKEDEMIPFKHEAEIQASTS
ncbi:acetyl-CoA-benzylalcohol acetyltransferase-like [Rhodamnia argentea]|uniref:Acetyl-CoA-benzylalcohol acetyltransferase-like n=1 Tax=Rhodamnia argentea TaxID=178133 RepID=A0ABM3HE22_9MYRT|nr:acetyl-CoA-benzylalcohol acetyltransferase-like [Rhodamnia argentea]